jgi:Domain of unknown function (DUF1844)
MTEPQSSEPKIIVDTDWKEQVAKEKAMAAESEANLSATGQNEVASEPSDSAASDEEAAVTSPNNHRTQAPPPASFEMLVTMLFTQAMAALGQLPNPMTGEAEVSKPHAKHYIDTLDIIGEKTKGNLSSEESKMLSEALHALRMMYVNVKQPAE